MDPARSSEAGAHAEQESQASTIKSIADLKRRYRAQYPVQALFDLASASWGEGLFAPQTQLEILQQVHGLCFFAMLNA